MGSSVGYTEKKNLFFFGKNRGMTAAQMVMWWLLGILPAVFMLMFGVYSSTWLFCKVFVCFDFFFWESGVYSGLFVFAPPAGAFARWLRGGCMIGIGVCVVGA